MSGRNRASSHGPRRSNADKRRAVLTMLQDEEWQRCSLSEIAARCRVSRTLVADIKSELEADGAHPAEKQDETITVKRRGKSYSMNVTKMRQNTQGRKKSADKLAPDFSADLDATLVEVLLELSKGVSAFPSPERMALLLKEHGQDFRSKQAREIGGWFQSLADHLDEGGQENPSPEVDRAGEQMETC